MPDRMDELRALGMTGAEFGETVKRNATAAANALQAPPATKELPVDDLIGWLRAQLDDDERLACEAAARTPGAWARTDEGALYSDDAGGSGYFAIGPWGSGIDDAVARHMVSWDPARVLAEVDAKRRIIEHAEASANLAKVGPAPGDGAWFLAVRLLARPYADRPSYRDEWRP